MRSPHVVGVLSVTDCRTIIDLWVKVTSNAVTLSELCFYSDGTVMGPDRGPYFYLPIPLLQLLSEHQRENQHAHTPLFSRRFVNVGTVAMNQGRMAADDGEFERPILEVTVTVEQEPSMLRFIMSGRTGPVRADTAPPDVPLPRGPWEFHISFSVTPELVPLVFGSAPEASRLL